MLIGLSIGLSPAIGLSPTAHGQDTTDDPNSQSEPLPKSLQPNGDATLKLWVQQLQHDEYLRREAASKRLVEAGKAAVPFLADAIGSGDLETTTRAVRVLSDLALEQPPEQDNGAWGALRDIADHATGSRQATAKSAVGEIEDAREAEALDLLTAAGVFIGYEDFAVGALTSQKYTLRIDDRWNGDQKPLAWLRWVRGIRYVTAAGDAVNDTVLQQIVRMPQVNTIALIEGALGPKGIAALSTMPRINALEIRYVKLTPEMTNLIAKLPIRESLSLMGTTVTPQRAELLKSQLPGLSISHRRGGFLGVTCGAADTTSCEIWTVRPGSAALKAGLRRADIVTEIDGQRIERFADLQRVIGAHVAGDELDFVIDRRGERVETKVTLSKQLD